MHIRTFSLPRRSQCPSKLDMDVIIMTGRAAALKAHLGVCYAKTVDKMRFNKNFPNTVINR